MRLGWNTRQFFIFQENELSRPSPHPTYFLEYHRVAAFHLSIRSRSRKMRDLRRKGGILSDQLHGFPHHQDGRRPPHSRSSLASDATSRLTDSPLETELALAEKAARAAAEVLNRDFLSDAGVTREEGKDLKTRADLTAEKIILDILSASPHPTVSEEAGVAPELPTEGPCWIVDPLDGTMNFARGFPVSCVSIALWIDAAPALGVILDLNGDRLYRGIVGQGAEVDGEPLRVSPVDDAGQAVLATGFPTGRSYDPENLSKFVSNVQRFKKIRMIGSAAMSLVYVASGVWEIYHEENVFLWDVAAGLALVEAAGGKVVCSELSSEGTFNVTASNGQVSL